MNETTPRPWHATTIGSYDQKHAAAKAFLAVMAVRDDDNRDIEWSDSTWIRNADDSLEVAFVGNGPKQVENAALIVEAVNAYDRLRAIEAAAREADVAHGSWRCEYRDKDEPPGTPCECGLDALREALGQRDRQQQPLSAVVARTNQA